MALLLPLFSGLVGAVVMSTLAAVLIYAAVGSFQIGDVRAILRTGRISQIAVIATFIATLLLPVAAAVGIGVVLSLLMQLNQEAIDLRVVELIPRDDGSFVERPATPRLESRRVVLLDVYGRRRENPPGPVARPGQGREPGRRAPAPRTSHARRDRLAVLSDYAERLADAAGRLYLSGVDPAVLQQLRSNRTVEAVHGVRIFEANEVVGESTLEAYHAASRWLATQR
jgi:SulP family sulfate permease